MLKLQSLCEFKNAREQDEESFALDPKNGLPRMLVLSVIRKNKSIQEIGDEVEVLVLGAAVERMGGRRATWAEHKRASRWTGEERKKHESGRKELSEKLKKLKDPDERIKIMKKYKEDHQPDESHGGKAVALEIPNMTTRGRCIVCRGTTNFDMVDEEDLSVEEAGKSWMIYAGFIYAEYVVCIMNERVLKGKEIEA